MTKPPERPVDTVGENQKRRLAEKRAEGSDFKDMQDAIRKGGYRQNEDGSYETNEGSVILESPTEQGRRAIYAASAKSRRDYFASQRNAYTDTITRHAASKLAADKELDIDWGAWAPPEQEKPHVKPTQADNGPDLAGGGAGDRQGVEPDADQGVAGAEPGKNLNWSDFNSS